MRAEMRSLGAKLMHPPSEDASRVEILQSLWRANGLQGIETMQIAVQRTFASFDEYWSITLLSPSIGPTVAAMPAAHVQLLKARMRTRLPADAAGRVTCRARANAIKGQLPPCSPPP